MTARWERRAVRLAWGIGLCSLGLVVASLVLLALDWKAIDSPLTASLPVFLGALITGILGVLIAARRPRNPIGWLLLAIAAGDAIYLAADFVAIRGLLTGASPRSWVAWPAWVFNNTGTLGVILLVFVILFFPNGRLLPGPRWRWAAWVLFAAGMVLIASSMIALAPIPAVAPASQRAQPAGRACARRTHQQEQSAQRAFDSSRCWVFSWQQWWCASAVLRDVERSQMRWFAYVAAPAVGLLLLSLPLAVGGETGAWETTWPQGFGLGLGVLVPATIGLAVMKYGLYDIDVFISRTIVYGSLAVFITAVYVGIAVGIGTLVGSGGKPNLGLSILATAIVAVGFQPVRERVQKVANRLVYGKRATPYEVLSQFSERVAESYASDDVLPRMARVLAEGTSADLAEVWLRSGDVLQRAAVFPSSRQRQPRCTSTAAQNCRSPPPIVRWWCAIRARCSAP